MNTKIRFLSIAIAVVILFGSLISCKAGDGTHGTTSSKPSFFEEVYDNPLKDKDLGGSDVLTLSKSGTDITLENGNVRLILDERTGGIKQIANKQANVYLVDSEVGTPFTVCFVGDSKDISTYSDCRVTLDDSAKTKKISVHWQIADKTAVNATISLGEDDSELKFNVSVENDPDHSIWYVQYPIVEHIDTLYEQERDYLAHPFATGYLFNDPLTNFNSGECIGISRDDGLYPSGWESPMQFFAYYSQGIGGFMFRTDDGGTGIKSFSFIGEDEALKAGIYHYADDTAEKNVSFAYSTYIGNLTDGTWYEAADIYRDWASEQSWCAKGELKDREDINKDFYEDTVLCNFNFPYETVYGTENQTALYNKIKRSADGKLFNIYFVSDNILELSKANNDLQIKFEFPDFHLVASANNTPSEWFTAVKDQKGNIPKYNLNGSIQFFECPSCEEYMEEFLKRENELIIYDNVSGFYHDVGVAAVHPKQCFNSEHSHGTRVNIIQEYLDQMEKTRDLAYESASGLYGQELVFEQMLPYLDFYQSRANAGLIGWMEGDRVRALIQNGSCCNINMFDYVYGSYGAVRLDGYLNADELIGESYYHIAAQTVLMGGIPEFNYEFVSNGNYLTPDEHMDDMLEYIGYLGDVRQGYGKDYLVYGQMVKAPLATDETIEYDYIQQRIGAVDGTVDGGSITWSKVITSAYRFDDTVGVFVCNPLKYEQEIDFIIDAERDYGIRSGTVTLIDENGSSVMCRIENGKAEVSWHAEPRQVILLKLEADK